MVQTCLGLGFQVLSSLPYTVTWSPVYPNRWPWLCFDSDYFDDVGLFFQVWIPGFAVFIPIWFWKVRTCFYLAKMYSFLKISYLRTNLHASFSLPFWNGLSLYFLLILMRENAHYINVIIWKSFMRRSTKWSGN